jgi:hypothetical protein
MWSGVTATILPPAESVPSMWSGVYLRLTGREKVATWFAGVILAAVILFTAVLLFSVWYTPTPTLSGTTADQTSTIGQYKALTDILFDRVEKLFDLVITKALLPLFATLIGFILGKQDHQTRPG